MIIIIAIRRTDPATGRLAPNQGSARVRAVAGGAVRCGVRRGQGRECSVLHIILRLRRDGDEVSHCKLLCIAIIIPATEE